MSGAFISVPHSCVLGEFLYRLRKEWSYQRRAAFPILPAKTSRGASAQSSQEEGQEVGLRSREVYYKARRA